MIFEDRRIENIGHIPERRVTHPTMQGAVILHVRSVRGADAIRPEDIVQPRRIRYLLNLSEIRAREMLDILSKEVQHHTTVTIIIEADLA